MRQPWSCLPEFRTFEFRWSSRAGILPGLICVYSCSYWLSGTARAGRLVPAARAGQPEVVAQRRAGVLMPEDPALAQQGHHVIDEQLEPGREVVSAQVEPVGGPLVEPVLDGVRDLLRRADDLAVPGPVRLDQLPDGEA